MKLMPISPRAYIKLYCQHHHHMPVPSMYQDHHIPSQDMCLNQVPTCTMHQSIPQPVPSTMYHNTCINHAPYLYHTRYQSCTIPCILLCANHAHQPCTSTLYHVPTRYAKEIILMMYLKQVSTSPRDVYYACATIYQVYTSTMYQILIVMHPQLVPIYSTTHLKQKPQIYII